MKALDSSLRTKGLQRGLPQTQNVFRQFTRSLHYYMRQSFRKLFLGGHSFVFSRVHILLLRNKFLCGACKLEYYSTPSVIQTYDSFIPF